MFFHRLNSIFLFFLITTSTQPLFSQVKISLSNPDTPIEIHNTLYGLNIWQGFNETRATNIEYQKAVRSLACSTLRFHNAGMFKTGGTSWVLDDSNLWNRPKLANIFQSFKGYGTNRLLTIKGWPSWMDEDKDGRLDETHERDFALFCAELVKIVNLENKAEVRWWEILNETDLSKAYPNGDLQPLVNAVNLAAIEMKKVDPTILLSGNAWSWTLQKGTIPFVKATPEAHDFFSWHSYTSMKKLTTIEEILPLSAKGILASLGRVRTENTLATKPLWLNEWNMFGSWELDKDNILMASPQAVLYDQAIYKALAESGSAPRFCAWNDVDGIYGKIDLQHQIRTTGKLMKALNENFSGQLLKCDSSEPQSAFGYAILDAKQNVQLALGNTTSEKIELVLDASLVLKSKSIKTSLLLATGKDLESTIEVGKAFEIPAYSVLILNGN